MCACVCADEVVYYADFGVVFGDDEGVREDGCVVTCDDVVGFDWFFDFDAFWDVDEESVGE